MNWKGFFILLGIALLLFLILHFVLQGIQNSNREKQKGLDVTLTQEEARNTDLHNELDAVGTNDYVIRNARENYDFISRNELRFEYDNPDALYAYTEQELQVLMSEMAD